MTYPLLCVFWTSLSLFLLWKTYKDCIFKYIQWIWSLWFCHVRHHSQDSGII